MPINHLSNLSNQDDYTSILDFNYKLQKRKEKSIVDLPSIFSNLPKVSKKVLSFTLITDSRESLNFKELMETYLNALREFCTSNNLIIIHLSKSSLHKWPHAIESSYQYQTNILIQKPQGLSWENIKKGINSIKACNFTFA